MAAISFFSGLASGIDTKSLIASILDQQRRAQIDPLTKQTQDLTDTNDSFSKLKELLNAVKNAAGVFRSLSGGSIEKNATSTNELIASATVSNASSVGSTQIAISQLARTATASFSDRFSSTTSVINGSINSSASAADRTVTVQVGQEGSEAENVAVTLDNTTTAQDFVTSFNSQSSKAEANLVNIGTTSTPSYAIVITSKNTGVDQGNISLSTGAEVKTAGSGALIDTTATVSQAANAIFSLSGISSTIERSSNLISDVVAGTTFNLTSVGTATISVTPDKESTQSALQKLVQSYNDVVSYLIEQNQVIRDDSGSEPTNIFSPLATTHIDENALSAVKSLFSSASQTGGAVNTFADLGVTTQRDGTLAFNAQTFSSAFDSDSSSVDKILAKFGDSASAVDGTISQFTRFGGLIDSAIKNGTRSITDNNKKISDIENGLSQQEESLTAQFARLESLVSQLNQRGQALTSLLPR